MPQDGVRTFLQGPWHYCDRCGRKAKIESELEWQRGKLLCFDCYDQYPLLGQYDEQVAEALETIVQSPDLKPSPKLTNPNLDADDDSFFI